MPILHIMAIKCGFKLNIILKELLFWNNSSKMAKFKNDIPIKRLNQQINMNATEYLFL